MSFLRFSIIPCGPGCEIENQHVADRPAAYIDEMKSLADSGVHRKSGTLGKGNLSVLFLVGERVAPSNHKITMEMARLNRLTQRKVMDEPGYKVGTPK
jgi:hypothetical protein